MKLEIVNHEVLKVESVQGASKTHIVKKHYDFLYRTKLTYLNNVIRAVIYNYLNEPQTDQNVVIPFVLEGEEIAVQAVGGVAEIEFSSELKGEYIVKTNVPNYRNGEVVIIVE